MNDSPRRPINLNGIFQHEDESTPVIQKSNRWQQQRALDGSPYTRHGASALVPPPAGPKLILNDLEKSTEADKVKKSEDPEEVVKNFIETGKKLGHTAVRAISTVVGMAKNSDCDDKTSDYLAKKQ